jgi:hypothetical protein
MDESVCHSNIDVDILAVFEQIENYIQSPEILNMIISEFNEKYRKGVTHTTHQSINSSSVQVSVEQTTTSKQIISSKTKMMNMIKLNIEQKIKEQNTKRKIEEKSKVLLNDDKKGFSSLVSKNKKDLDPIEQQKLIKGVLGEPVKQKFGGEEKQKGDEAGDLLFQNEWSYDPFDLNNFELEITSLDSISHQKKEINWRMENKNKIGHQIIEKKFNLGDVKFSKNNQVTEIVNNQSKDKKKLDTGDSLDIDLTEFGIDFNSDLGIDGLDVNPDLNKGEKKDIQFNNGEGMNYQIINKKNKIGEVNFKKDKNKTDLKSQDSSPDNTSQNSEKHSNINQSETSSQRTTQKKTNGSSKSNIINIDSPDIDLSDTDLDIGIDDISQSSHKMDKRDIEFDRNKDIKINIVDKDPKQGDVIIKKHDESSHKTEKTDSSHLTNPDEKTESIQNQDEESSESSSSQDDESEDTIRSFDPRKYKDIKRDPNMSHDSSHTPEQSEKSGYSIGLSSTDLNIDDLDTKSIPSKDPIKIDNNNESTKIHIIEKNNSTRSIKIKTPSDKTSSKDTSKETESVKVNTSPSTKTNTNPKSEHNSSPIPHEDSHKTPQKNPSQKSTDSISEEEEEESSEQTENEFSGKSDNPGSFDDYHDFTRKKKKKFFGKTIIALQFAQMGRRLAGQNELDSREKRRQILEMFSVLPKCLQKLLLACKPRVQVKVKECQHNSQQGCQLQGFKVHKQCSNSERFINGACYSNCPSDMTDHSLYCQKNKVKQRFPSKVLGDEEINHETEEIWGDDLKVTKCSVFGPSYTDLGPDLCIQKCPYGWRDLGRLCEKPFRFKNHKSFLLETVSDK